MGLKAAWAKAKEGAREMKSTYREARKDLASKSLKEKAHGYLFLTALEVDQAVSTGVKAGKALLRRTP